MDELDLKNYQLGKQQVLGAYMGLGNNNHIKTYLTPMVADKANPFDLNDVRQENMDVIFDGEEAFSGDVPCAKKEMNYARLEYRWAQAESVNRLFERLTLTSTPDPQVWVRKHTGTTWSQWVSMTRNTNVEKFENFTKTKTATIASDYFDRPMQLSLKSGVLVLTFGGYLTKKVNGGDYTIADTSSLKDFPLPNLRYQTAIVDVSYPDSAGGVLGSIRWDEKGRINLNLNKAFEDKPKPTHYLEFGLTALTNQDFTPLM